MKRLLWLSLFMAPAIVLASSGHAEESKYYLITGRETDFWPRAVNFVIFAALIYYLIANPLKNFFKNRKESIAARLREIEEKLQEAKNAKNEAQQRLEESAVKAEEIIADAKKEATLLAKKISDVNENELLIMEKQLQEKMELEERKSAKEVIDAVLNDNITNDDIMVDETKVVDIISKKVA